MASESVEFNRLPTLRLALHEAVRQIVAKTAYDIQAHAQAIVAVDTGFLKSSVYTITPTGGSTYGQGVIAGKAGQDLLPETDQPPTSDQQAIVAVGASYGIDLEFGTIHMHAQPYLIPATDAIQPTFMTAMERIEARMGGL